MVSLPGAVRHINYRTNASILIQCVPKPHFPTTRSLHKQIRLCIFPLRTGHRFRLRRQKIDFMFWGSVTPGGKPHDNKWRNSPNHSTHSSSHDLQTTCNMSALTSYCTRSFDLQKGQLIMHTRNQMANNARIVSGAIAQRMWAPAAGRHPSFVGPFSLEV